MSSTTNQRALTVQSWNLWFGGTKVSDGHAKIVAVAREHPADLVLLQECWHDRARECFAELGLTVAQQGFDTAVVSRHPLELVETTTNPYATCAIVTVGQRRLLAWSVHLAPGDYGPYAVRAGLSEAEIHAQPEARRRLEQIQCVLAETGRILAARGEMPVVIGGDFNSPAGSDWQQRDDLPSFAWPPVDVLTDAGFVDAFRAVYPDARTVPGHTWSPIEPLEREPRDRIDFVFARGLAATAAVLRGADTGDEPGPKPAFADIGGVCRQIPQHANNTYPSDHQLVEVKLGA